MLVSLMLPVIAGVVAADPLPTVEVRADNTVIDKSCRVVIPKGVVIADADDNGVIQIGADGITVEFAPGSVLRGAPAGTLGDALVGTGIRIEKHSKVTLSGAVVEGYQVGIYATGADGLTVEKANVRDIRRMHLRSTPAAEDGADWLWPHKNDDNEWIKNYGAAICVEDSSGLTLRENKVRQSQNGIVIDRVKGSKVYDNDCSFLSGWGLAMWRASDNMISRNAIDFCVRGYSHGVYNRGQDSAGILCFEQCSDNVFIENSVTHGGDGFFGFAGREALGEAEAAKEGVERKGLGCNRNLFVRNDLSYAPAHGLELTFSFDNWMIDNRFVQNNICGIWGGYSQRMHVRNNEFTGNGFKGAFEGGGINNEHSRDSTFADNRFGENSTAIGIWCNDNPGLQKTPWGQANNTACDGNVMVSNTFNNDTIALRMSDAGDVKTYGNSPESMKIDAKGKTNIVQMDKQPPLPTTPKIPEAIGQTKPVGARAGLRGRENIIMGEWGPWDHESTMLRPGVKSGGGVEYQVFGQVKNLKAEAVPAYAGQPMDQIAVTLGAGPIAQSKAVSVKAAKAGVAPYAVKITGDGVDQVVRGTIIQADWQAVFFSWAGDAAPDPRKDLAGWRKLAEGDKAVRVGLKSLGELPFGHGGPKDLKELREMRDKLPAGDKFGMIAKGTLELPKGKWKFSTLSDDGVRVTANGKSVIENWTWHAPTPDSGVFEQAAAGPVEIVVEYFEIDGFATLGLTIEPE
jgi:parallel beta-helix repeat protein